MTSSNDPMHGLSESDRETLASLAQHGDDASLARPIDHWLYFKNEADAQDAARAAFAVGYAPAVIPPTDAADLEQADIEAGAEPNPDWSVRLTQYAPATPGTFAAGTPLLTRIAEGYSGEYDGWECVVATDEAAVHADCDARLVRAGAAAEDADAEGNGDGGAA